MDPLAGVVHHGPMEWLVIGLVVAAVASLVVLGLGAGLATYRDRRHARRLARRGGGPGA